MWRPSHDLRTSCPILYIVGGLFVLIGASVLFGFGGFSTALGLLILVLPISKLFVGVPD